MSIINESILWLITVLHVLVIIFVIGAPFSDSNYLLIMHLIIVPFILLHWVLNNNTCSLTVAEKFIRDTTAGDNMDKEDCFTYKFIAPIYDFNKNNNNYSSFTYILTIGLWLITVYNLLRKYKNGEINSFADMSKI
jgi:hypothetical protein